MKRKIKEMMTSVNSSTLTKGTDLVNKEIRILKQPDETEMKRSEKEIPKFKLWKYKSQAEEHLEEINRETDPLVIFSIEIDSSGTRDFFVSNFLGISSIIKSEKIDKDNMYLHEIFNLEGECKIFMDIDSSPVENKHLDFMTSCYWIARDMCTYIKLLFDINLNVDKSVTFLKACREGKNSMHIIFDDTIIMGNFYHLKTLISMFIEWRIEREMKRLQCITQRIEKGEMKYIDFEMFKRDKPNTITCLNVKKHVHVEELIEMNSDKNKLPDNEYIFTPMIDMQIYGGSMRMYFSKKMLSTEFKFTDNKTRLVNVTPKLLGNIVWEESKSFSIETLLKTIIQFRNGKVIKYAESVTTNIGDCKSTLISINITNKLENFIEKTNVVINDYYKNLICLLNIAKLKGDHDTIPNEMLCFLGIEPKKIKKIAAVSCSSITRKSNGSLSVKICAANKYSNHTNSVIKNYTKIINERIKNMSVISPILKSVREDETGKILILNLLKTYCMIVREIRNNSGHINGGHKTYDKSTFLVVNIENKSYFQKCFHEICKNASFPANRIGRSETFYYEL